METTVAMDSALSAERMILFLAVEVVLPDMTIRLIDGGSEVSWNRPGYGVTTFTSSHPVAGSLNSVEPIEDGIGDSAPRMIVSLTPPLGSDAVSIANSSMQNSPIRVWLGALDLATKTVVADPQLLLDGIIDQPKLLIDAETRVVEYDCVSNFERFFRNDEGLRLSPTSHEYFWPGEKGLDSVTGVVKQVLWGPGDKISSNVGGGGGSSGGGFGNYRFDRSGGGMIHRF